MHRILLLVTFVFLPALGREAVAQRRARPENPGAPAGAALLSIGGKVDGKKLQTSGPGTCRHAPDASIGGASASLWTVEFDGSKETALRQLNLRLWRLKDGSPDQLSLALETSSGPYRIETGGPGETKGEGSVTILPSGPGGRLEIKGRESGGKPIQITIDCPAFSGIEAEGG
jgi:hypothetical protein